ncbi:MAG: tetratricopeptide repeat protein [Thermoguttaceae bacterium]
MRRAMLIAAAFWMFVGGTAWPLDQIYTSTSEKPFYGKIINMTATVINFQPSGKGPTEIPANEVARIIYENSPESLLSAQKFMLDGRYEKAVDALDKETGEDKRREVTDEIAFCRAYCMAQLALSGATDATEARDKMYAFIKDCPNSFHNLKACELMGDIFVTLGKFADAEKYYAMLSQAPWPDCKIRAQVGLGRSYLAQDNAAAADKAFDDALNNDAPGDLADVQRTAARIGKARCMVLTGKTDLALRTLDQVLDQTDEKNPEISAMAYNAQGTALRKAGKLKEAIRAFLRVHLLYATLPDLDAEAVANLEKLFTEDHKPKHASDMRRILDEKYVNSRWAKGVK